MYTHTPHAKYLILHTHKEYVILHSSLLQRVGLMVQINTSLLQLDLQQIVPAKEPTH